jgi:hypothetical protein
MPAVRSSVFVLLLAFAGTSLAEEPPQAPPFIAELQPMVGTWKRIKKEKKEPDLLLVIKEEKGLLRLRYQIPTRKKVYDSDWNGDIELDLVVNMKEIHELTLATLKEPPRIGVTEHIRYTGTWKGPKPYLEATYELGPDGKLFYRCHKFMQDDKEYPCPQALEYERISAETKWPK